MQVAGAKKRVVRHKTKRSRSASPSSEKKRVVRRSASKKAVKRSASKKVVRRSSSKKGGASNKVQPAVELSSSNSSPAPWDKEGGAKKSKKVKKVKKVKRSASKSEKKVKRSSSKRKPSSYIKWYTSEYRKIKKEHPNWDVKQCAKEGGRRWRAMSNAEKAKL